MEYDEYINSKRWQMLAREIKIQRGSRCELCHFPHELNVHHKHYRTLGNERAADLIVLCRTCHSRAHFAKDLQEMGPMADLLKNMSGTKGIAFDERREFQIERARERNDAREDEKEYWKKRDDE